MVAKSPSIVFQTLLGRLDPTPTEVAAAEAHASTIRTRLKSSFGEKTKLDMVGSHARGSAVRAISDVDYVAVLSRDEARRNGAFIKSGSFLEKVRADLAARFPQTEVSRDAQAVVVHFGDGDRPVDVVPAFFNDFVDGRPIYYIPSGDGENWLATSPQAHNAHLRSADERSGGKLKYTSQAFKWWRACWSSSIPLLSFHVEMLLAEQGLAVGAKSYQNILYDLFAELARRECRGLQDPLSVSGVIRAASSEARRLESLKAVEVARDRVDRAITAEIAGRIGEANEHWNRVFNGRWLG